jgi:lipopolysaccharide exporter
MNEPTLSKSTSGSVYHIAVSIATTLLGLLRTVLLMRLLAPQAFGIVSLALFFMTFVTPLAEFGIDSALIQYKEPNRKTYATHFVLRLLFGVVVMGLGLMAAPGLRRIYAHQTIMVDVFLALLGINLFASTYATPAAILRKELRFVALALLNLAASLAMTITAPLLAYLGAGLWSLVAEQAIGPFVRWLGLWVLLRPWRLTLDFDGQWARSSLKFGGQVVFSNTLGVLLDRFDDFWTGSTLGATSLGYYSRAYEIAQYPERVLSTPIINVFFATYAALQKKPLELAKAVSRSSGFLIRAGFLLTLLLAVIAPELTMLLFGETWLPIVPLFRLMLVYAMLDPLYANLCYLFVGVGRPDLLLRVRLLQVGLFIVAVVSLANLWGVNGVAIAANLMMFSGTMLLFWQSHRFVHFSWRELMLTPAVATIGSGVIGLMLIRFVHWDILWIGLLVKCAVIVSGYGLILFLSEGSTLIEQARQLWSEMVGK